MKLHDLGEAGYRKYQTSANYADFLMQKWVVGPDGAKKYSINAYVYKALPPDKKEDSFYQEACLYQGSYDADGVRVDVSFNFLNKVSLASIEERFEKVYVAMGCIPDPLNQ